MDERYDVVVIGGGPAGLSGAVALARFRRSVLVLDAGEPRNAPAAHLHNYLGRDGLAPGDLNAAGRAEVASYGGRVERARARAIRRTEAGFAVDVDGERGARTVAARRLLVTTGARDVLPDIRGLAARWGTDVLHCPFCHGYEVAGQRVGILATSPMVEHSALLFRQLTGRLTVLAHTAPPTDAQRDQLGALGIEIVDGEVVEVLTIQGDGPSDGPRDGPSECTGAGDSPGGVRGSRLAGVRLAGGTVVLLDALVVAPTVHARDELLAPLGLAATPVEVNGVLAGSQVEADAVGATAIPGLYVAGNLASPMAQVVSSATAGLTAASAIIGSLVAEQAAHALATRRKPEEFTEAAWEERFGAQDRLWSGNPNAALVAEVGDLHPGTALDAGAGEGGDAIWLAERGWQVTASDISTIALKRGRTAAVARGLDVAWLHLDLTEAAPPDSYDLVSSFFLHLPPGPRRRVVDRLAAAVAPGGTLLVVGHDVTDLDAGLPHGGLLEMGWDAAELGAELGPGWTVEVAEARPRTVTMDGRDVTIHDAVLRARRTL